MIKESVERQIRLSASNKQEIDRHLSQNHIKPGNYQYYCPFCFEVTTWDSSKSADPLLYSQCQSCKVEGTLKPSQCLRCLERNVHVFKREEEDQA
mmetsp:Transcript_8041/g.13503  ORF Transcript_8041/g.13503 Transcript_8041/m.13503 type:complete len:95 (+) Transcript_8041:58-342(+)